MQTVLITYDNYIIIIYVRYEIILKKSKGNYRKKNLRSKVVPIVQCKSTVKGIQGEPTLLKSGN